SLPRVIVPGSSATASTRRPSMLESPYANSGTGGRLGGTWKNQSKNRKKYARACTAPEAIRAMTKVMDFIVAVPAMQMPDRSCRKGGRQATCAGAAPHRGITLRFVGPSGSDSRRRNGRRGGAQLDSRLA